MRLRPNRASEPPRPDIGRARACALSTRIGHLDPTFTGIAHLVTISTPAMDFSTSVEPARAADIVGQVTRGAQLATLRRFKPHS
jgi:hypothetical protein